LDVASRVIQPSLPLRPGIVEVKTSLKSPIGRLMLANSITLTPGTLTVETHDDSFFIHWIDVTAQDVETASQELVHKFERYLEIIYG
jgi:multicomponent Na+:H+ antiporter subunit E